MQLTPVPKFVSPYGTIEFVPIQGMPEHTHRVAINGRLEKVWLPREQKPNRKAAEFYMRVWCALRDGLPKYHYADKNIDPPLPAAMNEVGAGNRTQMQAGGA